MKLLPTTAHIDTNINLLDMRISVRTSFSHIFTFYIWAIDMHGARLLVRLHGLHNIDYTAHGNVDCGSFLIGEQVREK